MSVKHLLIISFIFSSFILTAQETHENNELYSILLDNKTEFTTKYLEVNTRKQDFGTAYYTDKIVFTSSRTNSRFIRRVGEKNQLPFLDLYVAKQKDLDLVNVKPFNKNINKKFNEGPASFNEAGTFMAFSRNNYDVKNKFDAVKLQLFTAKFETNKWTDAEPVSFNSNEYSVAHPALTADGNTMYFVSDMPGGFGGTDLYVTERKQNGDWSEPRNLGSNINTKDNEMFPFIHENGVLFFASNGHAGLGGLDLFYSKKTKNNFSKPQCFREPINSSDDDFAFILNKKMDAGYFSSNRKNKKENDDIYSFQLFKHVVIDILLKGKVVDENNNVLANTNVNLYDNAGNIIKKSMSNENGEYNFTINSDNIYKLEGVRYNHKTYSVTIDSVVSDTVIVKDIILEVIPVFNFICNVKDKDTKQAIANTKITINDNNINDEASLYTDDKGELSKKIEHYKLSDTLNYTCTFEKETYSKKIVNYEKVLDKAGDYILNVEMEKAVIVLKGKAIDDKNNILANASVSLYDEVENKIKTIITDKNGEYNFPVTLDKTYKLEGGKEKHKPISIIIDTHVNDTVIIKDIVLKIMHEFNFICKLTDYETKKVVANTKLTIKDVVNKKEHVLYTDSNGVIIQKLEGFKLNDHLNYTVTFEKEYYSKKTENYKVLLDKAGEFVLNVKMKKAKVVLKGIIVDDKKNILANANVILYDVQGNKVKTLTTNKKGEFNFTLQAGETYKLESVNEKYKFYSSVVDCHTSNPVLIQNIVLEEIPEFNILCNLTNKETKKIITNAKITVTDKVNTKEDVLYTDAKGELLIKLEKYKLKDNLNYTFIFEKEGYLKTSVDYKKILNKAGNYILNVEMQRIDILLKGKTLDNKNNILANTDVILYDNSRNKIKTITTNENGEYSFTLQADRNYKIEAKKEKHKMYSSTIDTYKNDTVIIQNFSLEVIPEFFISCNVVNKKTKEPVVKTKITIKDKVKNTESVKYTNDKGEFLLKLENLNLNDQIDYTFTFDKESYSKKIIDYKKTLDKSGDYILNVEMQRLGIILKGKAFDSNNNVLANSEIYYGKGNEIKVINTDENGEYTISFEAENARQDGDKFIMNIEMENEKSEKQIGIIQNITNIPKINPIYFDYDKSTLRDDAKFELNKIVLLMNHFPDMHIELSSFADSKGSSEYNLQLSRRRAENSVNYIRERITNPIRISGKGLGEASSNYGSDDDRNIDVNYSEEENQKNRRTEFEIITK